MKANFKKVLSVVLAIMMLAGLVQITAFAEETYPALKLDTPHIMALGNDYGYVTFTPETTGDYAFESVSDDLDPCIYGVYDSEDESINLKYGDYDDVSGLDFFAVYALTAGETYTVKLEDLDATEEEFTVTVSKYTAVINGTLSLGTSMTVKADEMFELYTFTPAADGTYAFSSEAVSDADPWIFSMRDENGEDVGRVFGSTDDYSDRDFMAVYELEAGVKYTVCVADYEDNADGFELTVSKYYIIKEQPLEEYTAVEVCWPEDVKSYQWYKVGYVTTAITDQNATALDTDFGKATCDSTTGVWTVDDTSYNYYEIFTVDVVEGYEYCVEVLDNEVLDDEVHFVEAAGEDGDWMRFTKGEDGKYYLTADASGLYNLRIYTNNHTTPMSVKVAYSTEVLGDKVDGQTTDTLTAFDEDTEYACVVTYNDGTVLTTDYVAPKYSIVHQPTSDEPYVEVNGTDGATYQWYKVNKVKEAVTDENAEPLDLDEFSEEISANLVIADSKASYDSATDTWTGAVIEIPVGLAAESDKYYAYYYFIKEFSEGDVLVVELSDDYEICMLGTFDETLPIYGVPEGNKSEFTVPSDGEYAFAVVSASEDLTVKAYTETVTGTEKVDGQTENTLTAYEYGAEYYCEVTFKSSAKLNSDTVSIAPAFIKQPTEKDPSVEVNYPDNVKGYQWYEVEGEMIPITDEEAEAYDAYDSDNGYDSTTGSWTGAIFPLGDGEYGYSFFKIDLKAGDVLTVELTDAPVQIYLDDYESGAEAEYTVDGNTITFNVTEDGTYNLDISTMSGSTTIKAYIGGYELTNKLDGQTAAALTAVEKDKRYACIVTYEDGAELMSDFFVATADTVKYIEDAKKQDNADAVKDKITVIPENITKDDKESINAAKEAYDALTDEEKELVDPDTVKKLEDALAALKELETPATGDSSNIFAVFAVMLLSACALGLAVFARKRKILSK